jgi:hypothetical protein
MYRSELGLTEEILNSMDKIQGFLGKLKFLLQHIANVFPLRCSQFCSLATGNKLICVTKEHLNTLQKMFPNYFGKSVEDFDWAYGPFGVLLVRFPPKS